MKIDKSKSAIRNPQSAIPKAVFFDAADTLFRVRGSVGDVYLQIAQPYGATATPDAINRAFVKAFRAAFPMTFPGAPADKITELEKAWWYRVVHAIFSEVGMFPRFDEYFDELFRVFESASAWALFPETIEVLHALKERGLILGLISNFDSRIYAVCANLGIDKYIDSIVISSRAGAAKPAPEIFSSALRKNGLAATEALHVGDSLNEDIAGARAAGITPILIDRAGKHAKITDVLRITSLRELL